MRFVPKNKQRRHPETDAFEGLSAAAFAIRSDDKGGLSVTWIDHFGDKAPENIMAGAVAYRESLPSKKIGKEGLFALASVGSILATGAAHLKKLRVVHAPIDGNTGHAEIRHFTDDDLRLLEQLALEVFANPHFVKDLGLPAVVQ